MSSSSVSHSDYLLRQVYTVCGIYLACAVIAMIVVSTLLDPIKLDKEDSSTKGRLSPDLLIATFKHLFTSPTQILLIPLTMYSGVEQAFVSGDYTKVSTLILH